MYIFNYIHVLVNRTTSLLLALDICTYTCMYMYIHKVHVYDTDLKANPTTISVSACTRLSRQLKVEIISNKLSVTCTSNTIMYMITQTLEGERKTKQHNTTQDLRQRKSCTQVGLESMPHAF